MSALPHTVHCVGVAGGGLSALAALLLQRGHQVSGSDRGALPASLLAAGLDGRQGGHPAAAAAADVLVRSAAVPDDDKDVAAARAAGRPVLKYAEALGRLMAERRGVAVAGTHGKTSTTAMVAHLLAEAGAEPAWVVGGAPHGLPASAWGAGAAMVVEACEYDSSFLSLSYQVAVVTGLAVDHLDCFGTPERMLQAFERFVGRLPPGGLLVLGADAPRQLADHVGPGVRVQHVADALPLSELVAADGGLSFRLGGHALRLPLLARHDVHNLAAALLAASGTGVPLEQLLPGVARLRGVARRLQRCPPVALAGGGQALLIDDFAHHPDALRAAALAAADHWPGRRRVAVFQPHQVSRTLDLMDDFVDALAAFEQVLLCDVFLARDAEPWRADEVADTLAARAGAHVLRIGPAADAAARVAEQLRDGDVCLVMGAGDVDRVAPALG